MRSSTYEGSAGPAGSVGSGSLGAPGVAAEDQRVDDVALADPYRRARSTAWSRAEQPVGRIGDVPAMSCSATDDLVPNDSPAAGRWRPGTGVTRPTQCDDSRGVSTGTRTISRAASPATSAYRLHHLA